MTVEIKLVEIPENGGSISATALIKGKTSGGQLTNFYNGKVSFYTDQIINQLGTDDTITVGDTSIPLQLVGAFFDENGNAVPGNSFINIDFMQFVCYELNVEGDNISLTNLIPGKTNANTSFHFVNGYPINASNGMTSFGVKFTIADSSYIDTGKLYIKFSCTKREDPQSTTLYQWGILEFTDVNGLTTLTFNWVP